MTIPFRIAFAIIFGVSLIGYGALVSADEMPEDYDDASSMIDYTESLSEEDSASFDEEMDGDDEVMLDDESDGSMSGDDLESSDEEITDDLTFDGESLTEDDYEFIREMMSDDDNDEPMLIISHAGAQTWGGTVTVAKDGTSCENMAMKITFILTKKGIPLGHHYISWLADIGFINKDNKTHKITAVPANLLIAPVKPIPAGRGRGAWPNRVKTSVSGKLVDNIPVGKTTAHQITVCPH